MKQEESYIIKEIDMAQPRPQWVRAMVCQMKFQDFPFDQDGRLLIIRNSLEIRHIVLNLMNVALNNNVNIIVFPELSIPQLLIGEITKIARQGNMFVFAGTRYKKENEGIYSIGTMICPENVVDIYKMTPSPHEESPLPGKSVIPGKNAIVFTNTSIGNFAVTICADFMNTKLKSQLKSHDLDFLLVPSFHGHSVDYHQLMHSDIIESRQGLYILYSNFAGHGFADGKSALIGLTEREYQDDLKSERLTDSKPETKLFELKDSQSYAIFDFDITSKKPVKGRGLHNGINLKLHKFDTDENRKQDKFINKLGHSSDVFRDIDSIFVAPKEYDEIKNSLKDRNVVMIIGDPGIGKTYTAVHILYEYFQEGYEIRWISSLKKEEREDQIAKLSEYVPSEREILYLEDPFGRTLFEKSSEIKSLFLPLLNRIMQSHSKLIVTSRREIFEQFTKETLNKDEYNEYTSDLNIRKPSYSEEDLVKIIEVYHKRYNSWRLSRNLKNIFIKNIHARKLLTPYSIFNILKDTRTLPTAYELERRIDSYTNNDLSVPYSEGIKQLSVPELIWLYTVYFLSGYSSNVCRQCYEEVQKQLQHNKMAFQYANLSSVIEMQDGYRVMRMGTLNSSFRFVHPIIEEVLSKIYLNDAAIQLIAQEVFNYVAHNYILDSIKILTGLVYRHSNVALSIYKHLISTTDISSIDYDAKVSLYKKILNTRSYDFIAEASTLLPLKDMVESLYKPISSSNAFIDRLRILYKKVDELQSTRIMLKWENIFSKETIKVFPPEDLAKALNIAQMIDSTVGPQIECNLTMFEVQRLFIRFKTSNARQVFNEVLKDTKFENVYAKMNSELGFDKNEARGRSANKILWNYYLGYNKPKGFIYLDDGAIRKAQKAANIFLVGVIGIKGFFEAGDVVNICDRYGKVKYHTVAELSSRFMYTYQGLHSCEVCEMTGNDMQSCIVSRGKLRSIYIKKDYSI